LLTCNPATNTAVQHWGLVWDKSFYAIRDLTASSYDPLVIDAGLSGFDQIHIRHNYTSIYAIDVAGQNSNPLPLGHVGIWSLNFVGLQLESDGEVTIPNMITACTGQPTFTLWVDIADGRRVKACP
jgi:hypothetical protein